MSQQLEKTTPEGTKSPAATKPRWRISPKLDIHESEAKIDVHFDLPGVRSEDIDVHFDAGLLTVVGKTADRQGPGTRFAVREYRQGDYHRSLRVGQEVDAENIAAAYDNGVLTLTLPRRKAAGPHKIPLNLPAAGV